MRFKHTQKILKMIFQILLFQSLIYSFLFLKLKNQLQGIKIYNEPNLEECSKNTKYLQTELQEIEIKQLKLVLFEKEEILNKIDEIIQYINANESWKQGITLAFLEYVCKLYDILHYAYDINNECFMKYVSRIKTTKH